MTINYHIGRIYRKADLSHFNESLNFTKLGNFTDFTHFLFYYVEWRTLKSIIVDTRVFAGYTLPAPVLDELALFANTNKRLCIGRFDQYWQIGRFDQIYQFCKFY